MTGNITSQSILQEVSVQILNEKDECITGGTRNPNTNGFNLAEIDAETQFQILPAGTYRYVVKAVNMKGEEVLVNQQFLVK